MNLTIIGTGYVGLVTGACFADVGNNVFCVDVDKDKIAKLSKGIIPISEPGLDDLVVNNQREGRLRFTSDLSEAALDTSFYFIAVGTPQGEDGAADLHHVLIAAQEIGRVLCKQAVVVIKSTVPVGTTDKVQTVITEQLISRNVNFSVSVVSNPEFLKQGAAVNDFMKPDRIIVGCKDDYSKDLMKKLYAPFVRNHDRMIFMDARAAEMTKYASNSMLAAKISFMNEIANLCEHLQVDVEEVRQGMGADARIGYSFIYPGCGYGGSCFPKDVKALIHMAEEYEFSPDILRAVESRNDKQKRSLSQKVIRKFGSNLTGMSFALWGLAFKPGTDDMREAPSIAIVNELIDAGARIVAYDPVAYKTAKKIFPKTWFTTKRIQIVEHQYDALRNADALLLVTEWKSFRNPDFKLMKDIMKKAVIFDGRNQYDPKQMLEIGFEYVGIGR